MAQQAGIYAATAVGVIALLGVGAGILYRKHCQDKMEQQAREQVIQERMQHAADLNLPPLYVDHEQDPVCIYEHELPPDALPPVQPILVHSISEDHILIPPEEDPLVVSPTVQRTFSALGMPVDTVADESFVVIEELNAMDTTEATVTETTRLPNVAIASTSPSGTSTPQTNQSNTSSTRPSLVMRLTGLSGLSTPTSMSTPPEGASPATSFTQAQSPAAAVLSPRIIDREMLNRARLRAPPSYDVPNRVIDRSPHMIQYLSPEHPQDDFYLPSACVRDDYFGRVRVRAHTVSHPPQSSLHQQHQLSEAIAGNENRPETPRYSLEFPSHVPHHQHLERHQRARALATMESSPEPSLNEQQSWDGDIGPQSIRMEARSYSQPYYSSSNMELGIGNSPSSLRNYSSSNRSRPIGMRSRASTLGESSKLLIQRMQTLWKKTAAQQQQQQQQQQQLTGLGLNLPIPTEASADEEATAIDYPAIVTSTTDETTEDTQDAVETTEDIEQGSNETDDATENNLTLPRILLSPSLSESLPELSSSTTSPLPILAS
ncbi:hypothetical protein EMPS_07566 [Entomortierella parvispora]|uniref:Uncharacterized protein n=1 Tax=Entomortierella parvispora TaxID=205924 RepID=A0A9P3HES6_9FUNG|nr:hypothetical protein EMPS_07566 [Entomortierella parvispora]